MLVLTIGKIKNKLKNTRHYTIQNSKIQSLLEKWEAFCASSDITLPVGKSLDGFSQGCFRS